MTPVHVYVIIVCHVIEHKCSEDLIMIRKRKDTQANKLNNEIKVQVDMSENLMLTLQH